MRCLLLLALLAAPAAAGDPRPADLPFRHLRPKEGVTVVEGTRFLGDVFPYLDAAGADARPVPIVPATAGGHFVIDSPESALAVARIFVAGPLVTLPAQADRVVAAARDLKLEHLTCRVDDYRPESYEPAASAVEGGFEVSFVAFEMDNMLQLVHVTARVTAKGVERLERKGIVTGPMTSWQTALLDDGEETEEQLRVERAMREEAVRARAVLARALRPARDLDTAWALGRALRTLEQVRDVWGDPDRRTGSGLMIDGYDLPEGTTVFFAAGGPRAPFSYVRHVRRVLPGDKWMNLHRLQS